MLCLVSLLCFSYSAKAQWTLPTNPNLIDDFDEAVMNLTEWLLGFSVMVAIVALIWGGLNYIASSGDTQKIESSKTIIYYAFIGVVIAGISYAIVKVIVTSILT